MHGIKTDKKGCGTTIFIHNRTKTSSNLQHSKKNMNNSVHRLTNNYYDIFGAFKKSLFFLCVGDWTSNEAFGDEFVFFLTCLGGKRLLQNLSATHSTASGGGKFTHVLPVTLPFLLLGIDTACRKSSRGGNCRPEDRCETLYFFYWNDTRKKRKKINQVRDDE